MGGICNKAMASGSRLTNVKTLRVLDKDSAVFLHKIWLFQLAAEEVEQRKTLAKFGERKRTQAANLSRAKCPITMEDMVFQYFYVTKIKAPELRKKAVDKVMRQCKILYPYIYEQLRLEQAQQDNPIRHKAPGQKIMKV